MAMYDDVDGADVKLPILTDRKGKYLCRLEKLADGKSRKTGKGYFKAEVQITAASGEDAYPVNTRAVILIGESQYGYHKKDIASLTAAIINEPVANVKGPMVGELVSAAQPATGTLFWTEVRGSGKDIKTGARAGEEFVGAFFSPADQTTTPGTTTSAT